MRIRAAFIFLFLMLSAAAAQADPMTINLGLITFDNLIPDDPSSGTPGTNGFTISNLTGDPAAGGFALQPDFPVYTDLIFQNSVLSVDSAGSTTDYALGDLTPGMFQPDLLQFSDAVDISSATFTATISPTSVVQFDGSTLTLDSATISAELEPGSGQSLTAGQDFVVLSVEASPSVVPVPEPSTFVLLGIALTGIAGIHISRRRPLSLKSSQHFAFRKATH